MSARDKALARANHRLSEFTAGRSDPGPSWNPSAKPADPLARIPYCIWFDPDWMGVSGPARSAALYLFSCPEAVMAEDDAATLVPEGALWAELDREADESIITELESIGAVQRRGDGILWVCDPMVRFAGEVLNA